MVDVTYSIDYVFVHVLEISVWNDTEVTDGTLWQEIELYATQGMWVMSQTMFNLEKSEQTLNLLRDNIWSWSWNSLSDWGVVILFNDVAVKDTVSQRPLVIQAVSDSTSEGDSTQLTLLE